ncbi:hypothetical protein LINGRAHAP2_LOCUS33084 [Linum grandiflorum]
MEKLPKLMVLYSESVGKYINFYRIGGGIQVKGDEVWSPKSRFEVVQSKLHPTMVHIRCSYNNKYLRRYNEDEAIKYIYPSAEEPEDDPTKWSSTLFLPEFFSAPSSGGIRMVSFRYVHTGLYVQCNEVNGVYYLRAYSPTPSSDPFCVFRFTDWESIVTLPKHVTFRGDNGSFLGLLNESGAVLRFEVHDRVNETIPHEVVALSDGTLRIKNASQGAFWKLCSDDHSLYGYILADDFTTSPTPSSIFQPVKVDDKTIALRSMGNQLYCKRYTGSIPNNSLAAMESEITEFARLELTELVTRRTIQDLDFGLENGWVYDYTENVTLNGQGQVVSNESDQTRTIDAKIYYKDTKTACTWTSANSSLDIGPAVTIQPDRIPDIIHKYMIVTNDPFQTSYVWGETTVRKSDHDYKVHRVKLLPWTEVTVQMKANLASCRVPFAYTRYDVLDETTGLPPVSYDMDDGVYVGTNYFGFTFCDTEHKPIPKKK